MKNLALLTKKITQSISILLFIGLPVAGFAHDGNDHYGPHMMWQGYGMVMGPFMMLIFVALIVIVGVLLARWLSGHGIGPRAQSRQESLDILKNRFARGEINKEEFEERKQILQNMD